MPVSATTLELLMKAGLEGDALLAVVRSIDADNQPKRSSGAERQARYRNRKASQSDVTSDVTESPPSPPTPPTTTPKKTPPTGGQKKGPRPIREDWAVGPDLIAYAERYGLSRADAEDLAERMKSWAGSKGVRRASWFKTFQTFVQRESQTRKATGNGKTANKSSLFDLHQELADEIARYGDAEAASGDETEDRRDDDRSPYEAGGRADPGRVVPLRLPGATH